MNNVYSSLMQCTRKMPNCITLRAACCKFPSNYCGWISQHFRGIFINQMCGWGHGGGRDFFLSHSLSLPFPNEMSNLKKKKSKPFQVRIPYPINHKRTFRWVKIKDKTYPLIWNKFSWKQDTLPSTSFYMRLSNSSSILLGTWAIASSRGPL